MKVEELFAYFSKDKNGMIDVPKDSIIIPLPNEEIVFVEKNRYELKNCGRYFKVSGISEIPLYFKNKNKMLEKLAAL